jgi:hypothetical protein
MRAILTSGSTRGEDVVPPCGIASSPTLPEAVFLITCAVPECGHGKLTGSRVLPNRWEAAATGGLCVTGNMRAERPGVGQHGGRVQTYGGLQLAARNLRRPAITWLEIVARKPTLQEQPLCLQGSVAAGPSCDCAILPARVRDSLWRRVS